VSNIKINYRGRLGNHIIWTLLELKLKCMVTLVGEMPFILEKHYHMGNEK
jgi:hypothetical protein